MIQNLSLIVITISLILFTSCNETKKDNPEHSEEDHTELKEKEVAKKDCKEVHWSHHTGEEGPENWKHLCDGFSDCGLKSQSPINIVTTDIVLGEKLLSPNFSYGKSSVDVINNGHTVQFNVNGENNVDLNGKEYKLLQFHYHALSEHTIDGNYSPIEVHFVHKHSDTDFAVLGVMFKEGKENQLFKTYLAKFPTKKGTYKSEEMIDLLGLFPENKSYYHYSGSLTTPPCSEVVSWYVLKNPIEASKEQIEQFSEILHNNYRPVQALNDRAVKLFSE